MNVSSPRDPRALVVDDYADGAELLAQLLEFKGYRALIAETGAAALDLARESAPDVVFLDIRLPDMDGYEVARRLRAERSRPQPTLVAVTGLDCQEVDRAGVSFDHCLTKPFEFETLERLLVHISSTRS